MDQNPRDQSTSETQATDRPGPQTVHVEQQPGIGTSNGVVAQPAAAPAGVEASTTASKAPTEPAQTANVPNTRLLLIVAALVLILGGGGGVLGLLLC